MFHLCGIYLRQAYFGAKRRQRLKIDPIDEIMAANNVRQGSLGHNANKGCPRHIHD